MRTGCISKQHTRGQHEFDTAANAACILLASTVLWWTSAFVSTTGVKFTGGKSVSMNAMSF